MLPTEEGSVFLWNERKAVFYAIYLLCYFQKHTLELAALSPSIESLNEASIRLPLSDFTLKKMQTLTRQWSQRTAAALEHCRSEMQTKKSLLTISFSVRKSKTKLKHGSSCSLFSAFLGAFQAEFLPFWFTHLFSGYLYAKSLEAKIWLFVGEEGSKVPRMLRTTTLDRMQTYPEKQPPMQ